MWNKFVGERVSPSTMSLPTNGDRAVIRIKQNARARTLATLLGSIAITGVVASAHASSKTIPDERARQICQTIIRIQPGENHFGDCVSSLSDSRESARRYRAIAQERDTCYARSDLKAGSPELNLCLLQAADAKPGASFADQPDGTGLLVNLPNDPQSSEPYSAASSDTVLGRERQACALLGFDPAFGAFAYCVADLQGKLQEVVESDGS
jgi:hypothetical protein